MKWKVVMSRLKHGTVREDGLVFWGYHKGFKSNEEWTTRERFNIRTGKKRARQWFLRRRRRYWINKYKEWNGCSSCGYDESGEAIDFHHTDNNKCFNVSDGRSLSLKKLFSEIRKCVLLCKNCHAIETARENFHAYKPKIS